MFRSCDVSSHDPVIESHDPDSESHDRRERTTRPVDVCVSLSSEQREILFNDEPESHLTSAVGRWCEWGGWEEGEREMGKVLHYLRLAAELCCVTRQVRPTYILYMYLYLTSSLPAVVHVCI